MRISCLGGGPAGLYFAILTKQARPDWSITVHERNAAGSTFGWGVVFSDQTMAGFRDADPSTHAEILRHFRHWDDIDVFFKGRKITSGGHGFCGIGRATLLDILARRAATLGVDLRYGDEVTDPVALAASCDLLVAADGVNSIARERFAASLEPDVQQRKCRYIWLGTQRRLDAFTFDFRRTEAGWFTLHAYRFDADWSTFIVETPEENWRRAGLDRLTLAESIDFCENLFAERLEGARLVSNARHLAGSAAWLKFQRVSCRRWHHQNVVLLGDAAHTAHFSIGSGTKLAMEDAMALSRELTASQERSLSRAALEDSLARYQDHRELEALKLQSAARNRMEWFENVERYVDLEPEQFAYSLLTGSQRLGHASLKLRDAAYVESFERWYGERAGQNVRGRVLQRLARRCSRRSGCAA